VGALLDVAELLTRAPGRALARAWARPGYFDGPLVRTPTRRALVLACAWVGDTLWDLQVVPALEAALPEAEVHVATRRRSAALAAHLPPARRHVLEHVPSDRRREPVDLRALAHEAGLLRGLALDLVVDLTGNRYSALFAFLTRPRAAVGFGAAPAGWLYTKRVTPPIEHLARRPWRVIEPVTGPVTGGLEPPPWPALPPGADARWPDVAHALGLSVDDAPVVLAPGAGWAGKRWPVERFAALASRLRDAGHVVVVTGAAAEDDLVARVAAPSGARALVGDDLAGAISLCARARLVVSNDSGLAHLAAAAGTPVVALFSATNPELTGPLGPRVTVLRAGCEARPEGTRLHCHDAPGHPCPSACWDALSIDEVERACARHLGA
jgi:ADP-heptose:LPS heptosyltransferase